ncbi:MAG: GntR family transcriptional regulator [Anaerolineaceae bacterium]|jgi:GntR family transcriptional regulator
MKLAINPSSPLPLYYQIREQLRAQIRSGALVTGDPLPGEMQICQAYGVSRMTARQALVQLANEGLVVRKRGRGTFVAAPKAVLPGIQGLGMSYTEIMEQAGMSAGGRVLAQEIFPATGEVAANLKIKTGEPVVRIVRIRSASGEIMSRETACYPYSRFPDLAKADLANASIYRFLQERYGVIPAYATDTLEIAVAGPYEAEQLHINEGGAIALVTTIACLEDDTPVAYTHTIHRGDRFRSVIRRSRQPIG